MNQEIFAFRADYHPVLAKLMDQMGLVETINTTLREEAEDVLVDTGTVVAAMIHNLLGEGAIRLYRLSSFFADKPLPLFFPWSAQLDRSELNDDRAGRALDMLWATGPQKDSKDHRPDLKQILFRVFRETAAQLSREAGYPYW
ncbi:MAG: DUF4277 domain-containing protein [Chloroflexota bacterium]|nr:MAG: DUF4277 domain-containing protein [Chloroflexota bacterium]